MHRITPSVTAQSGSWDVEPYNRIPRRFIPAGRGLAAFVLFCTVFALPGPTVCAEESVQGETVQGETFHDEQRITAVDVLVTYERDGLSQWATGNDLPTDLENDDFVVRVDEQPVQVVTVAPPEASKWHFVVYFDSVLMTPETMTWAATQLGEYLDLLLAEGSIEIVVADPLPRRWLRPTDDRDEVARVLSQLALRPNGRARLQRLRDEFLALASAAASEESPEVEPVTQALVDLLVREEHKTVAQRHDQLITWLVDGTIERSDDTMAPEIDRRGLIYISDGFDPNPENFYAPILDGSSAADPSPAIRPDDDSESIQYPTHLNQVLASYGWVALPMLPPEPELLTRGLRLGKFLIKPLGPHVVAPDVPETARADQYGLRGLLQRFTQLFMIGAHVTYEEHRDPDKAEAYLELALALHGQDELEDAVDAYEKALFHFSGDPRTAERQAVALAGVGDMMAQLGDTLGAQQSYHLALRLDPDLAQDLGTGIAFSDPAAALRPLAEATVGRLLRHPRDFQAFFGSLPLKVRLTYQLEKLPAGHLQDLEIQPQREGAQLRHPRWTRSGTPDIVVDARLRQLLAANSSFSALTDGETLGSVDGSAPVLETSLDAQGTLQLMIRRPQDEATTEVSVDEVPPLPKRPLSLRISLASADLEGDIHIVRQRISLDEDEHIFVPSEDFAVEAEALAVLVEDVESGGWLARVLDW